MAALESLVEREGACSLPGVSIAYDVFMPIMMRAVARGYVRQEHAEFVADGLRWGFDLGVDVSKMRGKRLYKNYPTALVARDAVTRAVRKRVETFKTYKLFKFKEEDRHLLPWPDWRVFPMGAVAKPMEPGEMRPYSDHTKTGMKSATDVEFFRHTLTATEDIARFLKHAYYMRVSDIDAAFPLLPVRPRLWRYLMFRWYDVEYIADSEDMCLYVHVCGDFGSAGMPGTFKIFFSDVVKGMASSELVLTLPAPVHVDDISLIGAIQEMVDKEGKAFSSFLKMLGIYIKEIKDRAAAQVQLALGFWWNSIDRTRTLVERKHQAYISMLDEFEKRRSLTLKDRQQAAGRMQRAVLTMPPGAACFLATTYSMMRGLTLPWHARRTSRAERMEYSVLKELLQRNMGKGYFSLDQFEKGPEVHTDASKESRYAGGGYASQCGRYRWWFYGASAKRHPIDFLEGDAVVVATEDLGHLWHRMVVKFRIDNTAFQKSAVKGWSRAERLTLLLRRLFTLCMKFECVLLFEWIPTLDNFLADALSRQGGEPTFLERVKQVGFLQPGAILRRDPRCGQARQLGDTYSSNTLKDGPRDVASSNLKLTVTYNRASVYIGLPSDEAADWVGEVMSERLGSSSHRSINSALAHWDRARAPFGWHRLIVSDDPERGGKMAVFVQHMAEDTDLVGGSIANYVWAFRSWLKFQRQLDPIYGVVDWEEFMQAVMVRTWVPSEPRKEVPLSLIREALRRVDVSKFHEVQAAHLMLVLLFSFARSETPVAKAYSGEGMFDPNKQLMVEDVRVVPGALHVRLKGIKQDPRMQRPEAAGNNDWVVIGDVPGSIFSILLWTGRLFALHGGPRDDKSAFYLDKSRKRPYIYSSAMVDIRSLWSKVVGAVQSRECGLHGLRVAGYNNARQGPGGEELAVAHGGWKSTAHRRYERFGGERSDEVVGLAKAIVDQLVEPGTQFERVRPPPSARAGSGSDSLWPAGPPPPLPQRGGGLGQARQASGRTLAVDRVGPTVVRRGTRIKVHWVDMSAWYEGTVTSQRAIDGAYDTRVFYDAVGSWRSHAAWHNLDNEEWDLL